MTRNKSKRDVVARTWRGGAYPNDGPLEKTHMVLRQECFVMKGCERRRKHRRRQYPS